MKTYFFGSFSTRHGSHSITLPLSLQRTCPGTKVKLEIRLSLQRTCPDTKVKLEIKLQRTCRVLFTLEITVIFVGRQGTKVWDYHYLCGIYNVTLCHVFFSQLSLVHREYLSQFFRKQFILVLELLQYAVRCEDNSKF